MFLRAGNVFFDLLQIRLTDREGNSALECRRALCLVLPAKHLIVGASEYCLSGAIGYLLGSIPTGYLVAKAKGIDIRKYGSGNIGATNAFRVLGKPAGILVLVVDALKGALAAGAVPHLFHHLAGN